MKFFTGGRIKKNTKSKDIEMMAYLTSGDETNILISKTADVSEAKANTTITKVVQFSLVDADGNVHNSYSKGGYTVTATPSAGAITMTPTGSANVAFVNGVATVSCAINAACHNNAGANTIVLTAQAIHGVTPSGANLTHTITFT